MKIAFVDPLPWDYWVETPYQQPLGGSQSALCYLAEALAGRGCEVFVLNRTSQRLRSRGVACFSIERADERLLRSLDALVVLNNAGFGRQLRTRLNPNAKLVFWTQHAPDQEAIAALENPEERNSYDAIAFVSRWQQQAYRQRFPLESFPTKVLPNAIAPAFCNLFSEEMPILPQKAQPPILAYTSTPFRGLELLLDLFPAVCREVPEVRLQVFSSMKVYGGNGDEDTAYDRLYRRCAEMPGVAYVGSVPQPELAVALRQATLLAYPNIFAETSCIAAMEAIASGCRVVTTDWGALPETTAGFARLVPLPNPRPASLRVALATKREREAYGVQFVRETVEALRECQAGDRETEDLLRWQVTHFNRTYTWAQRARAWQEWLAGLESRWQNLPAGKAQFQQPQSRPQDLQQNPTFDPQTMLELYATQQYDRLSEAFLEILEHFDRYTYYQIDSNAQYFINAFVKTFLYLFTQPDYILGDAYVENFIRYNAAISNLVAISAFGTTDAYLEILKAQPQNFAKVLALYSARNRVAIERDAIFASDARLACLWYSHFFPTYASALLTQIGWERLQQHARYGNDRLTDFYALEEVYLGATYIDNRCDRLLKQRMNRSIQIWLKNNVAPVPNDPDPRKIAIVTAKWFGNHVVYRTICKFIDTLRPDFELTLIHLGDPVEGTHVEDFQSVLSVKFTGGRLHLDEIRENSFAIAYFADIGMNPESILLSNLRFAPIQIHGAGHPISTFGSRMDYFISGAAVEMPGAEENYSERLVLLPGSGAIHERPNYILQNRQKTGDRVVINCPWSAQKLNFPMVRCLQEILQRSSRPLLLRFFSGAFLSFRNGYIPFERNLHALLGADNAELVNYMPYAEYMALLEEGDFAIDAFHFGGSNSLADCFYLRQPAIAWEGTTWYNRIGPFLLRSLGMEETIATNREEYVALVLKLVEDEEYRLQLRQQLQQVDLDRTIFSDESKGYFKKAIAFLLENHERLQQQTDRTPIWIR